MIPFLAKYRDSFFIIAGNWLYCDDMTAENPDNISANVQAEVDAAVNKGQFPDRRSAIAGLTKQLVDYQKGALKDQLKTVDPVESVGRARAEHWKELMEHAGGDEDEAVRIYVEELKRLKI